jgi:hypothetical protein
MVTVTFKDIEHPIQNIILKYCKSHITEIVCEHIHQLSESDIYDLNIKGLIDLNVLSERDLHEIDVNHICTSFIDGERFYKHITKSPYTNEMGQYLDLLNWRTLIVLQPSSNIFWNKLCISKYYQYVLSKHTIDFYDFESLLMFDHTFVHNHKIQLLSLILTTTYKITSNELLKQISIYGWRLLSIHAWIDLPLLYKYAHKLYWPYVLQNRKYDWQTLANSEIDDLWKCVPDPSFTIPTYLGQFLSEDVMKTYITKIEKKCIKYCNLYFSILPFCSVDEILSNNHKKDFTIYTNMGTLFDNICVQTDTNKIYRLF